jgi:hypothetical protein
LLTRRAHVAPPRNASEPTPSSNSARATFIPVPARDMLSFRSIATQAEVSCTHREGNPAECRDPPSAPTTASPSPPLRFNAFPPTLQSANRVLGPWHPFVGGGAGETEQRSRFATAEHAQPQNPTRHPSNQSRARATEGPAPRLAPLPCALTDPYTPLLGCMVQARHTHEREATEARPRASRNCPPSQIETPRSTAPRDRPRWGRPSEQRPE